MGHHIVYIKIITNSNYSYIDIHRYPSHAQSKLTIQLASDYGSRKEKSTTCNCKGRKCTYIYNAVYCISTSIHISFLTEVLHMMTYYHGSDQLWVQGHIQLCYGIRCVLYGQITILPTLSYIATQLHVAGYIAIQLATNK